MDDPPMTNFLPMELNVPVPNLKSICGLVDSGFIQLVSSS